MKDNPSNTAVWESADTVSLAALKGNLETDVCVVGLGQAGLVCARELKKHGLDVVGVDAGRIGGGASGRNGGFLLAGLQPFYHRACEQLGGERARLWYRLTLDELARIGAETPGEVRFTGSLRIACDAQEAADCRAQWQAMANDRLPAEWYEGPEGEGLLIPTDGAFQPWARCRALARMALAEGARLFEHSEVRTLAGGEVQTRHGRVRCRHVVVAVDGGLESLLPELAGRVRTARLQALATAPVPEVRFDRPVYARYGLDYWQQLPDGRVVLGGCRDRGGEGEWTREAAPTGRIQRSLDSLLQGLGLQAPVTHRWAGLTAYTADGMPLFEAVRPGLVAIGGYGGTGNVLGPLLGRQAARWVAGAATDFAPADSDSV